MSYSSNLLEMLQRLGAAEGDHIEVRSEGRDYAGILMPHHQFSHPDVLIIKLDSGYNIGIRMGPSSEITAVQKADVRERGPRVSSENKGLPSSLCWAPAVQSLRT